VLEKSPLAQQLAIISATLQDEADRLALERTLLSALHLLIHACLLRILSRLESLIALWQAGQLPTRPQTPTRIRVSRVATVHPRAPRHRQARPSFSEEKEAKRLFIPLRRASPPGFSFMMNESFLVLFYKKEPLPSYSCLPRFPPRPKFALPPLAPTHDHFIPV
jgi:hypothetical protein